MICSCPFFVQAGSYFLQIIDWYTSALCILFVATMEPLIICWIYGKSSLRQFIISNDKLSSVSLIFWWIVNIPPLAQPNYSWTCNFVDWKWNEIMIPQKMNHVIVLIGLFCSGICTSRIYWRFYRVRKLRAWFGIHAGTTVWNDLQDRDRCVYAILSYGEFFSIIMFTLFMD